ncbi:unnamed protein product [Ilex paraguariensis]|uniref:Eukaryotic translation initiation factor 4G n=1 Tax=Ilex paraguariensis TaxID=185542 RepID=A0ABC8QLG5_9AQUA
MSLNQSRADKSESSQHRKSSRSGSFNQQRNSGGRGKGGGGAPAPPTSWSSSLSLNQSFKKCNNAQGGQSRTSVLDSNSNSNNASADRIVQNGAHFQPPLHADAPLIGANVKPTDVSTQKSTRPIPKVPSSNAATVMSDTTAPTTPAKAPADASKSFPFQFGSISPGLMNGMQIPARTSSAPPNLDEQNRDQARHDLLRAGLTLPMPSIPIPKQQLPRKDAGTVDQSNTDETHPTPKVKRGVQVSAASHVVETQKPSVHTIPGISMQIPFHQPQVPSQSNTGETNPTHKVKRDVQVSVASPVVQTQKPSVHPIPGVSLQIPFHQPHVPIQFGGSSPQIESQGMTGTSLPMPVPLHLQMGNLPQVQQPVFVAGLQPHPMQTQGIMHQGHGLNFSSSMGPQLPPQLGNLGIGITQQFSQQQAGNFGSTRKTVKITHPDTHEELRLDGSSGQRTHPNVPPISQPIPLFPPAHPINYYPNTYNASSPFFPAPNSLPSSNTSFTPISQAPRFYNQVSQGPPTASFIHSSALNSISVDKTNALLHGIAKLSTLDHSSKVHNIASSPSSTSIHVTVKPAAASHGEKAADTSLSVSSSAVEKSLFPKLPWSHGVARSSYPQQDCETLSQSSLQQSKFGIEPTSTSVHGASEQSVAVPSSVSTEIPMLNSFSAPLGHTEDSAPVPPSSTSSTPRETIKFDFIKDPPRKLGKEGQSLPQNQIGGLSSSFPSLSFQSMENSYSLDRGIPGNVEVKITPDSSGNSGVCLETTRESLATIRVATPDASDSRSDCSGEGTTQKSSEMFDAGTSVDTSLNDQQSKLETVGTKEQEEIVLPKGSKQYGNSLETCSESISVEPSKVTSQIEQSSGQGVTVAGFEIGSSEIAQRELKEPVGFHTQDDIDKVAENFVTSTFTVQDAINIKPSPSALDLSTISLGDKVSIVNISLTGNDGIWTEEVDGTTSGMLDQHSACASVPPLSEATLKFEGEGADKISAGLVSLSALGSKDKPLPEPNRGKSVAKRSRHRKELHQKADAAGTTSDICMAYKGPKENKETVISAESMESSSSISLKQAYGDSSQEHVVSSKNVDQSKAEPDNWEDAADISTPKLETYDEGKHDHGGLKHQGEDEIGVMARKYTRDFLLIFAEQCIDLPDGFDIAYDLAEALIVSNLNVRREPYPSPGRVVDRLAGGPRLDRRGSGIGNDDKWSKVPGPLASGGDMRIDIGYGGNVVGLRPGQGGNYGVLRTPRAQTPVQYVGGILSGPMQSLGSQGGVQRNGPDSDRWQRATSFQKGLIPSPHTPSLVMHKAEKKYEVGKVTDEEQAKQRQLKGILNKLTPQNFEKLFEQVKQVKIDNAVTLTGVISQIFDKALMEPTFCEMYANFCSHLAGDLPDLNVGNEKITFKRLLLNKCQEEFERGEREQEEANKADEEGDVKQSEQEREEKRIQARRRMLGNIRLIGELYKKKMLTERIMHECINKLLGQPENPDEEDVEALCKLMSTIGVMIDHPKAKERMDGYFDMMARLSNNMKLSSRVRFMLKDAIDLRKNKWQQRRKVEGPKKIEEVHRDAAQERQAQVSRLARAPSISSSVRRNQTMDFVHRGSNMLPSPSAQMGGFRGVSQHLRGYGAHDVRFDDRLSFENRTLSVPLPQRPIGDDSITLGPQGGLARGMSNRGLPSIPSTPLADTPGPGDSRRMTGGLNGYNSALERTAYGPREDLTQRYIPERFASRSANDTRERNIDDEKDTSNTDRSFDRALPTSSPRQNWGPTLMQNVSSDKVFSEKNLEDMSMAAIKEFYSARDENEVALCIKDMNAPSFYPSMISIWVTDSFEMKDRERDLLAKLLINLAKSKDVMISQDQLLKGFASVLTTLEDVVNDAPRAAEFLGCILAKLILENVIRYPDIGQLIYEGGEEKGRLVEIGLAAEVLGRMLEIIKSEKGDSALNEILTSSSLSVENFRPPESNKTWRLDEFLFSLVK